MSAFDPPSRGARTIVRRALIALTCIVALGLPIAAALFGADLGARANVSATMEGPGDAPDDTAIGAASVASHAPGAR